MDKTEYWDLYILPDNIKNRLSELNEDIKEEDGKFNIASIVDFCKFSEMIDEEILKEFKLSITPDGNLYAGWNGIGHKNFMHFIPKENKFGWLKK